MSQTDKDRAKNFEAMLDEVVPRQRFVSTPEGEAIMRRLREEITRHHPIWTEEDDRELSEYKRAAKKAGREYWGWWRWFGDLLGELKVHPDPRMEAYILRGLRLCKQNLLFEAQQRMGDYKWPEALETKDVSSDFNVLYLQPIEELTALAKRL